MKNEHLLIGISYSDYRPGMKLFIHEDHENLKSGDIVEIDEINGFDKESNSYSYPWRKGGLYFITTEGVKIPWNEVSKSCYIDRNEITSFLEKMFEHYVFEADRRMADFNNYEWSKDSYDRYLEEKNETLIESLIKYEHDRVGR